MEDQEKRPRKAQKIVLWIVGTFLVWGCLTAFLIVLLNKSNQSDGLRQQLQAIAATEEIPLYYTATLPKDITPSSDPINKYDDVVIYSLMQDNNKINVTQQPRPAIMEEVSKVKDVASPLGKAYIANLGNHIAGFLVTDKTMVIVSSQGSLDSSTLEALLKSMTAL